MKKIDLGQAATVVANLAVVAGIIFLVVELRQNNETLELQQRISAKASLDALRVEERTNVDLRAALLKDYLQEELTLDEQGLLGSFTVQLIDTFAWVWDLSPESRADLQATLPDFSIDRFPASRQEMIRDRLDSGAYSADFVDFMLSGSTNVE